MVVYYKTDVFAVEVNWWERTLSTRYGISFEDTFCYIWRIR